ncbi:hypothetical protein N8634_00745 [bacterium]|nr:hypothetical protein [bacterium]
MNAIRFEESNETNRWLRLARQIGRSRLSAVFHQVEKWQWHQGTSGSPQKGPALDVPTLTHRSYLYL